MSHSFTKLPMQAIKLSSPLRAHAQRRLTCPQCAHRTPSIYTRQFTTTRRRNAGAVTMHHQTNVDSKLPKQVSAKSQMKKASRQQIGTDLGKLPHTFILPPAQQLPPVTSLKRIKIHWLRLKTAFKDFWGLVVFLKWDVKRDPLTGKRMRKPLQLNQRMQIARDLHKEFHEALGDGDMKRLQPICCEGVMGKARTRIEQRKAMRKKYEPWSLISYGGIPYFSWMQKWPIAVLLPRASTRVVSDRLAPLPFPDTFIRQCTVRITSVQDYHLANTDRDVIMKHIDYVVIQKMTTKGEDGPWKIWGITEPSTTEEIDKMLDGKANDTGATLAERIQDKLSGLTGTG